MIGETRFDLDRQMRFAMLSGDHNPIHVDPVAVRRTLPARLVVHGVHVLLWTLGLVADLYDDAPPPIARIRVRFLRFTYVGDLVRAEVTARRDGQIQLRVIGDDVVRAEMWIMFGPSTGAPIQIQTDEVHPPGAGPLDHGGRSFDGRRGLLPFMEPAGALAADFPAVARWLGAERIDALAAATRLVGMIYPGLHSLLGGIDVRTIAEDGARTLAFEMGELGHGQIDATISGGGIVGRLDCRAPEPPVAQPSSAALRGLVAPGSYAGARVLVVGGSRGVGEVSAKLLALGGAGVAITYRDGAADAAAVAADINQAGGRCTAHRYDAGDPADALIEGFAPTHACWFATPVMVRPELPLLDERRRAECWSVLVHDFARFATSLHIVAREARLLYPSPQWIDAPPPALADYLMAKAAGEVLARSLDAILPGIRIFAPRLPAMATDQTNRIGLAGETADAAETMLPHLDRLIGDV